MHYGRRSYPMRNVKDETVYDPAAYDRDGGAGRAGFWPRRPGDPVRRPGAPAQGRVRAASTWSSGLGAITGLLVVGSRETPDLRELAKRAAGRATILPPQPPERMAALNLAADLVILWLDPAVPASHYQSPYKLTDALAMGPAIIASPVGGLAELCRPGCDVDGAVRRFRPPRRHDRPDFCRRCGAGAPARAGAKAFPARILLQFRADGDRDCGRRGWRSRPATYPVATRFAEAMAAFEARLRTPP